MIKERKSLLLNHKRHHKLKSRVENKKDICKNKLYQQLLIRPSRIFPSSLRDKEKSKYFKNSQSKNLLELVVIFVKILKNLPLF